MADSTMGQRNYFFQPTTAYQYSQQFTQQWTGNKIYVADNPPYGGSLRYRLTSGDARRDSAQIVITDVKGDVVRKLMGPGGAGVHTVMWDLRGLPAPLGPSGIRDSVNAARERQQRADSLRRSGGDTTGAGRNLPGMDTTAMRAMRDSMSAMRARGDTAGMRALREKMQAAGGGRPGGRGRGAPGAAAAGELNLRPAEAPAGPPAFGGRGRGGFGRFRAGPPVPEGDYLVTITVNGTTMKRALHVERIGEIPEDSFGFGDNEEDEEH
jgi:hypothetical protein